MHQLNDTNKSVIMKTIINRLKPSFEINEDLIKKAIKEMILPELCDYADDLRDTYHRYEYTAQMCVTPDGQIYRLSDCDLEEDYYVIDIDFSIEVSMYVDRGDYYTPSYDVYEYSLCLDSMGMNYVNQDQECIEIDSCNLLDVIGNELDKTLEKLDYSAVSAPHR